MAQRRLHFIDVPPPQVIWLAAGAAPSGAVRQAEAGAAVRAGAVVAGVEHTSTVAVTPLPGTVGEVCTICDSRARQRQAVAVHVAPGVAATPAQRKPSALDEVTPKDLPAWIDRLERAGVRADRHNSPDLIGQLIAAVDRPIDSILCHALEADPTLPVQMQWALRHPLELRDGLRLLARLTGARRTVLAAAEGDNRRLFRHLRRSARGELAEREARRRPARGAAASREKARQSVAEPETEIRDISESQSVIVPFDPAGRPEIAPGAAPEAEPEPEEPSDFPPEPARDLAAAEAPPDRWRSGTPPDASLGVRLTPVLNAYPQADPTLLVWALLSRRLRPGRMPPEAGAIVLDAVAAVAIGAVARGAGVVCRQPLAVRDHRSEVSLLADVWRGMRASDALKSLGLLDGGDAPALRGGDFLRERMLPLDCVLDGGEILLHLTAGAAPPRAEPCIRCGWCLDICPTHVHPAGVLEAAQRGDGEMAERFGVSACIECGLCTYICPSRLPLMKAAQMMKKTAK